MLGNCATVFLPVSLGKYVFVQIPQHVHDRHILDRFFEQCLTALNHITRLFTGNPQDSKGHYFRTYSEQAEIFHGHHAHQPVSIELAA